MNFETCDRLYGISCKWKCKVQPLVLCMFTYNFMLLSKKNHRGNIPRGGLAIFWQGWCAVTCPKALRPDLRKKVCPDAQAFVIKNMSHIHSRLRTKSSHVLYSARSCNRGLMIRRKHFPCQNPIWKVDSVGRWPTSTRLNNETVMKWSYCTNAL